MNQLKISILVLVCCFTINAFGASLKQIQIKAKTNQKTYICEIATKTNGAHSVRVSHPSYTAREMELFQRKMYMQRWPGGVLSMSNEEYHDWKNELSRDLEYITCEKAPSTADQ